MNIAATDSQRALDRLRVQWVVAAVTTGLLLAAAYLLLRRSWAPPYALRWLALAAGAAAYQLAVLWRDLPLNHRPGGGHLFPDLGLANVITLFRGLLLAGLAGFLFSPWPAGWLAWAPGTLYTAAIVLDLLDGLAARLAGRPTALGASLDVSFDALGILVAPLLGVWYGQLPVWYLLVSAARYLYVLGVRLREQRGLPVHDLPPSDLRRPLAGLQMGFISAVLWPVLGQPEAHLAATLVMLPFVAGFLRDWLVVSGRVEASGAGYRRLRSAAKTVFTGWLPLVMRAATGLVVLGPLVGFGVGLPGLGSPVAVGLAALVVSGLVGRLAAVLLLISLGLALTRTPFTPGAAGLLASLVVLMLFGTGRLSLWQPEERFMSSRMGEAA